MTSPKPSPSSAPRRSSPHLSLFTFFPLLTPNLYPNAASSALSPTPSTRPCPSLLRSSRPLVLLTPSVSLVSPPSTSFVPPPCRLRLLEIPLERPSTPSPSLEVSFHVPFNPPALLWRTVKLTLYVINRSLGSYHPSSPFPVQARPPRVTSRRRGEAQGFDPPYSVWRR